MPFMCERSHLPGFASSSCSIPSQIVGTPAVHVTFSCDEVLEQALRVEVGPGEDELRAQHRGEIGVAPGVRVEHRHDREQRVVVRDAQAERRGGRDAERVQDRRAVRVDDALAAAGRAAREAHRGGRRARRAAGSFHSSARRRGEQLLVAVLDDDHVLDLGLALERVEQRQQALVDDHGLVVRVVRRRRRGRSGAGAG